MINGKALLLRWPSFKLLVVSFRFQQQADCCCHYHHSRLFICHRWVQRQGNLAGSDIFGLRQIVLRQLFRIGFDRVHRWVVPAGLDALCFHGRHEGQLVHTFWQQNWHDVVAALAALSGELDRGMRCKLCQHLAVELDPVTSTKIAFNHFYQLHPYQVTIQIIGPVVVAQVDYSFTHC
jgi:hypothetical protein